MRHEIGQSTRFFFATALMPCPYLPGRIERRIVTELVGRDVDRLHDVLSSAGFRRSHGVAYAPACPDCNACVPVRIDVRKFKPSRSQKRIRNKNRDLTAEILEPRSTQEQYVLFSTYQDARHGSGDMAKMDHFDYQALIEETPVETWIVEFRDRAEKLAGACLVDPLSDGLSAVYSFFDPDMAQRSLGTQIILWLVEQARERGLPYVYLGFWIRDCQKMSYKTAFQPLEGFFTDGWHTFDPQKVESQ